MHERQDETREGRTFRVEVVVQRLVRLLQPLFTPCEAGPELAVLDGVRAHCRKTRDVRDVRRVSADGARPSHLGSRAPPWGQSLLMLTLPLVYWPFCCVCVVKGVKDVRGCLESRGEWRKEQGTCNDADYDRKHLFGSTSYLISLSCP